MAKILLSALSARRGGGQTYIRNIVPGFPRGAGHTLSILSAVEIEGIPEHPNVERIAAPAWTLRPISRILFGTLWFRFLWAKRHDFDIVYFAGGSFDFPVAPGVRRVVAFRNMLPFDRKANVYFPHGYQRVRHWLLRRVQGLAMKQADLVVFISSYAQDVINSAVGRRRGLSVVIHHGANITLGQLDHQLAASLPERFVLYLSLLEAHKAQVEVVKAWALLRRSHPKLPHKLVLAGPIDAPYTAKVRTEIAKQGMDEEILLTGSVDHDQVSDLAKRADLNLFFSRCENCPNILLELLAAGRPVLSSDIQPMPELGGEGIAYAHPDDSAGVARAIAELLTDSAAARRNSDFAMAQSRRYDWSITAERTWRAIIGLAMPRLVP